MKCPNCQRPFPPFTSWKMNHLNPLTCKQCGTRAKRLGRLQPLLIAVCGIIIYGFALEFMPLSTAGKLFVLGVVLFGAMWIDERTLKLTAVDDGPTESD